MAGSLLWSFVVFAEAVNESGSALDGGVLDGVLLAAEEPTEDRSSARTSSTRVNLGEVVVEGRRPLSAASSDEIRARDYQMRPHSTTQEILNNVPGLVVSQHQGGGKAAQYLVRGFDSDHGTDFALFVDGLPVNMPTHGHGQGYADLNFLIPETVDRIHLHKGPYFTDLGDFATAGALRIVTKDEFEESFALAEGGAFDTQRYVLGASPKLSWGKAILAAEGYFSNGPFNEPQSFSRYNLFGKLTFEPSPDSKLSISGAVFASDWDASGQIPLRAVQAGSLFIRPNPGNPSHPFTRPFGRFDTIDPTEGGSTDRQNLNVQYTYQPATEETWTAHFYASRYSFRLYSNFTFYQDTGLRFEKAADGGVIDRCAGVAAGMDCSIDPNLEFYAGDGIDQDDMRVLFGGRLAYDRSWSVSGIPLGTTMAVETRRDDIDVALHRQIRRHRFYTINQLNVEEQSVAGYLHQEVYLTDWARLEAGLRGDVYFFNGNNRLPEQSEDHDFESVAISGNEVSSIVSPKANLIVTPIENTDVYLNFGSGFHSNDARSVLRTGQDGLVRALGTEIGSRTRQFDRLDLAASLWLLDLDSELTFSGDGGDVDADFVGGVFVPGPATRRWGVDFETRYRVADWLFADYDLSWADPRVRSTGEAVPLAPTLLMNGGLTAAFQNGFSSSVRFRFLDDRPANENRSLTARGYALFDLLARYRWRNVEVSLALLNLADRDWREAQFANPSCVRGEVGSDAACSTGGGGDGVEDIHFTPGNPFAARGGLTLFF